jgi:thiamine-monophosphate kinase
MTHEFDLIRTFFKPLSQVATQDIGIGDDGAVLSCPLGQQLVVVTDTMVEGVHFPLNTLPEDIGWKALAVNLSDLAAMGARPAFFSLALSLPESKNHQAWLKAFSSGLRHLAEAHRVPLIGGDTTRSDRLTVTVTAHGWVPAGQALRRSGARPGDGLYVSGYIGDGALGLMAVNEALDAGTYAGALQKLNRPEPRVALGGLLVGLASSAIDVSDGLLADIAHLLGASQCGCEVDVSAVPYSQAMQSYLAQNAQAWSLPLTGGDDYELCFTVPAEKEALLKERALHLNLPITEIGRITAGTGAALKNAPKGVQTLEHLGFQHF